MSVLVDTSVWSLSFRRKAGGLSPEERAWLGRLQQLFQHGQAAMIGPVRQEILTGIRDPEHFKGLRRDLRSVPDIQLTTQDFESAAEISNQCAAVGVAGSSVDFLICSVALRRGWQVFTTDKDFSRYARVIALKLVSP